MDKVEEGSIIEGSFWREPIEVKKLEELGNWLHIIGATIYSGDYVDQLIPITDLKKIKELSFPLNFSASGEESFLALEGQRYKFASLFDPLLAMNVSKIDPLPFQIEAVYGYILRLPHIRFLIADDPGAGKTIMAGLIIKEMKLRGLIRRILIVVPGHLKDQWRREMKEKFQENFVAMDRGIINSYYGENPWQRENQVITSMDFAKREEILSSLAGTLWDLIIVDEAHKMSAYKYGEKIAKSDRYKLGELLSKNSEHLLFLTATPHKGDPENYRLFLDLLNPGFFAKNELVEESIKNKDNPLFIRRMKEDMRDFEGKPIFTNRYPITVKFKLSEKEKILYNDLSRYVISQYNKALQIDGRRNVAFALLILQRRMASSTYALLSSLRRRKNRLGMLLKETEFPKESIKLTDIEEYEDYEEEKRWEQEKIWETLSVAKNKEELKKEIITLDSLIVKAEEILREESEVKLKELKKAIEEGFKKIREIKGNEKILIFTESRDTMEYLVKRIKFWEYSVNFIHGGMRLEDRVEAEKIFKNKTQVMVATEAAGEGINLQFCHIMINYDIPWNPNRLEQRMGRIHRYGQQKDVYIFNLVAEDTREGKVLSKLFDKLEEIRGAMGNDKVFDTIGDIFYGRNLYQLILDAVANTKSMDEIIREIDIKVDQDYLLKIREALGESLATRHIDYTRIKEMAEKSREYRLIPEYIEEFFKKAFVKAGGNFKARKDGFISVDSIPYDIRKIAEEINFKNKYGLLLKFYNRITFDKEIAFKNPDVEFVCFGHPLFEALLKWVKNNFFSNLQKGTVFKDPSAKYNGILWFYEGEVKDGKGEVAGKRLLTIYDNGNDLEEINPAILWDLIPQESSQQLKINLDKKKVQTYSIDVVNKYKEELSQERKRQAEVKRKYGIKSLSYLIDKLDAELVELYERQLKREKVELVIRNKEESKKNYQKALENLKKEIEQELSLSISMPKFVGAIFVKSGKDENIATDKEIERIGMQIAKEYEKNQKRKPDDVSKENLGFDIRSKGENEIRYIEVKARKDENFITLTPNEWFKAKRFKEEYWLYVVANAGSSPTLYIVNNPVENLKPQEKIEIVRFLIPVKEWKNKGKRIDER